MYVVSEWFGLTSVYSTTRRTEYSSDNLRECLNSVQNKTMYLREASRHFRIPRSTIQKRLKSSEPEKIKSLGRYKRAFSDNMEIHMQGASVAPVATFAPAQLTTLAPHYESHVKPISCCHLMNETSNF